jgi:ABC-2 type transport system permease protein
MRQLLAIIRNEIQLLLRDLPGLTILFVMPMLLVLILTTLHSVDTEHPKKITLLIINKDKGIVSKEFIKNLEKDERFATTLMSDQTNAVENAQKLITAGTYQILLILPAKLTNNTIRYSNWLSAAQKKPPQPKSIQLFLDPTLSIAFKNILESELKQLNQKLQIKVMQDILKKVIPHKLEVQDNPIINIKIDYASAKNSPSAKPNSVQQYVPAWTIFGMFLIMIPIAGVFVKEREQGIVFRLSVAPIVPLYFLLGRMITFVLINLIQMTLMLSLGIYILPLIGLHPLNITGHVLEILVAGLAISLAATGFGVLLGVYARTFEQAMALGPTLIIIAAAIGGIMLPIYLMPEPLKLMSDYSPLFWAQNMFIKILVRETSWSGIKVELASLICFFVATVLLALVKYMKKR